MGLRRALVRKGLAFDELRVVLARSIELRPIELLVLQYLAYAGELTPSELAARLALSSAGCTALVQRLDRSGCVVRRTNPRDHRSVLLQLAPEIEERVAACLTSLVEEIDATTAELSEDERHTIEWYLDRVAELTEEHAHRARRAQLRKEAQPPGLSPRLWA